MLCLLRKKHNNSATKVVILFGSCKCFFEIIYFLLKKVFLACVIDSYYDFNPSETTSATRDRIKITETNFIVSVWHVRVVRKVSNDLVHSLCFHLREHHGTMSYEDSKRIIHFGYMDEVISTSTRAMKRLMILMALHMGFETYH